MNFGNFDSVALLFQFLTHAENYSEDDVRCACNSQASWLYAYCICFGLCEMCIRIISMHHHLFWPTATQTAQKLRNYGTFLAFRWRWMLFRHSDTANATINFCSEIQFEHISFVIGASQIFNRHIRKLTLHHHCECAKSFRKMWHPTNSACNERPVACLSLLSTNTLWIVFSGERRTLPSLRWNTLCA